MTRLWSTPIPSPSGTFSHTEGGVHRLYVGGKDERLRRADFVALATLAGLRFQPASFFRR